MRRAGLLAATVMAPLSAAQAQEPRYTVVGDAIPKPLADKPGDATRGRAIVANRTRRSLPALSQRADPEERFQGTLAPSLAGGGGRWSVAQLRLRIVDGSRLNPDTIMPPYYRTTGLQRVAKSFEGKTILTAEQIEDVVAYLATLKD